MAASASVLITESLSLTVKDAYQIPRVDECLNSLSGSKWYSSMDLKSVFWQVGLWPEDRQNPHLHQVWDCPSLVMPFGLTNSISTLERLSEYVLIGLQWLVVLGLTAL